MPTGGERAGRFAQKAKRDALRFAEADKDGDNALDWDEFLAMQPARIREQYRDEDIRQWFTSADVDSNGSVSINEFFMFTLQKESLNGVEGLRALFQAYDKDGTGYIDMSEFQLIADDLGFGAASHEIFMELDDDNSGYVQYSEVLERLVPSEAEDKSALSKSSSTTKKFLMAIAWTANDGESKGNKAAVVDTSTWELDATTADELAAQLREHVVSSGAAVADLVELFNWQETGEAKRTRPDYYDIDEKEFLKTLRQRLGYTGPVDALRGCFALLGGADDGKISLTEFFEWATGRKNAMLASEVSTSRLMSMRLVNPPLGPDDDDDDDEWSIDMLRSALQQMLIKARVPPHVLQTAWDHDGDGVLSRNEFLARCKRLVVAEDGSNSDMWYFNVRPTVKECFAELAGSHHAIDLTNFTKFLNKRWPKGADYEPPELQQKIERKKSDKSVLASANEADAQPSSFAKRQREVTLKRHKTIEKHKLLEAQQRQMQGVQNAQQRHDHGSPAARPGDAARAKRAPAIPIWRMDPTTPLYEPRVRCAPPHSTTRPAKQRPHSRMIWAGIVDDSELGSTVNAYETVSPRAAKTQTLAASTSLPALGSRFHARVHHSEEVPVLPPPTDWHDRWREMEAVYGPTSPSRTSMHPPKAQSVPPSP